MTKPWVSVLGFVGLLAMLVGAIDPLEGSFVILPGGVVVVVAAILGKSPHRRLLYWGFALLAAGIGALWGLSAVGGFGGSVRSWWWGLTLIPYPVGWGMMLVATVGKGRYRKLLYVALFLMAVGIVAISWMIGAKDVGEGMVRSKVLLCLSPYLLGALLCLVGAILTLVDELRSRKAEGGKLSGSEEDGA